MNYYLSIHLNLPSGLELLQKVKGRRCSYSNEDKFSLLSGKGSSHQHQAHYGFIDQAALTKRVH